MTRSKKTYKLHNVLPAYTVSEWFDYYKNGVERIYSTPANKKKGQMWDDYMTLLKDIKILLKKNNVKFI